MDGHYFLYSAHTPDGKDLLICAIRSDAGVHHQWTLSPQFLQREYGRERPWIDTENFFEELIKVLPAGGGHDQLTSVADEFFGKLAVKSDGKSAPLTPRATERAAVWSKAMNKGGSFMLFEVFNTRADDLQIKAIAVSEGNTEYTWSLSSFVLHDEFGRERAWEGDESFFERLVHRLPAGGARAVWPRGDARPAA